MKKNLRKILCLAEMMAVFTLNFGCDQLTETLKGEPGETGATGAAGKDGQDGTSIVWKGSFASADEIKDPQELWAYYNTTDGCSYVYNGTDWELLAKAGENGADAVSFLWLGSYATADEIEDPEYLNVYYNTSNGCSYVYNGTTWELLAKAGENGSSKSYSEDESVSVLEQLNEAGYVEGTDYFVTEAEDGSVQISWTEAAEEALKLIVMPTSVEFTNFSAKATENGIYFEGSLLSNVGSETAKCTISIQETEHDITMHKNYSAAGNAWSTWNTTYPLVEAGKIYNFSVRVDCNSNRIADYTFSIKATGGLGEYYITNPEETACIANGRVIQKKSAPEYSENPKISSLVSRTGTNYYLYYAEEGNNWANWLYETTLWDDVATSFSIRDVYSLSNWRTYDYIDNYLSGHKYMYSTQTIIEIAGCSEASDGVTFWMNDWSLKVDDWGGEPYKVFVGTKAEYNTGSSVWNSETEEYEDVVLPVTNLGDWEKYYVDGEEYYGTIVEVGTQIQRPYILPKIEGYRFVSWTTSDFPFRASPSGFVNVSESEDDDGEEVFLCTLTPNFEKVSSTYNKILYAEIGDVTGTEEIELNVMSAENAIDVKKPITSEETLISTLAEMSSEINNIYTASQASRTAVSKRDASTQALKIIDDILAIYNDSEIQSFINNQTRPKKDFELSEVIDVSDVNAETCFKAYYDAYKKLYEADGGTALEFNSLFNQKIFDDLGDDLIVRKLYAKVDGKYDASAATVELNEIASTVLEMENIESFFNAYMGTKDLYLPIKYAALSASLNSCAGTSYTDLVNFIDDFEDDPYPKISAAVETEVRLNVLTQSGAGGYVTIKASDQETEALWKLINEQYSNDDDGYYYHYEMSGEQFIKALLSPINVEISVNDGTDVTFEKVYTAYDLYKMFDENDLTDFLFVFIDPLEDLFL